MYTQHFVWKIVNVVCDFISRGKTSRHAHWGTDYYNPAGDLADHRHCFSFDKAVSATCRCLFLGCSLLGTAAKSIGCSQRLPTSPAATPQLVQNAFLSSAVWVYQNSCWKCFWEPSCLLSLMPCTALDLSRCLEGNTSQVLGFVFCFFFIWILASQGS